MRPLLVPALARLWRDATTLQLGVDPDRAVVLSPIDAATARFVTSLDGRSELDTVIARAPSTLPRETASALVAELSARGVVVNADELGPLGPAAAGTRAIYPAPSGDNPAAPPRSQLRRPLTMLGAELDALLLVHGNSAGHRLAARHGRTVLVRCRGRIGPVVAAILAATGMGGLNVIVGGLEAGAGDPPGTVGPADVAVGGLVPSDVGRPYALAVADAVRRAAPDAEAKTSPMGRPDFAVLAAGPVLAPTDAVRWTGLRVPHLPVLLRDGVAMVGPLVVPGRTACLVCVEEHRRDRDPDWPALAAQLATGQQAEPGEVVVVGAAAAIAALQVACHLDGGNAETVGTSLEIRAGAPVRYRTWTPHPRCGCTRQAA